MWLISGRARVLVEAIQPHSPQTSSPLGLALLIIGIFFKEHSWIF